MGFQVNAVDFGIMPYNQKWVDFIEGYDHLGRPILSATKNVELSFDNMSVSKYSQFSALHGTSLTSIQLLGVDSGSYTVYNTTGIYFFIKDRPQFEAGNVTRWNATVVGLMP